MKPNQEATGTNNCITNKQIYHNTVIKSYKYTKKMILIIMLINLLILITCLALHAAKLSELNTIEQQLQTIILGINSIPK